jgi:hypothetical protein
METRPVDELRREATQLKVSRNALIHTSSLSTKRLLARIGAQAVRGRHFMTKNILPTSQAMFSISCLLHTLSINGPQLWTHFTPSGTDEWSPSFWHAQKVT